MKLGRPCSRNTWAYGSKRRLRWFPNHSEFAGGHECGTAIPLGSFVLKEDGVQLDTQDCYNGYEKANVILSFIAHGTLKDTQ